MFTSEKNGMLSVLVCDLGIGIARSLPLRWSKSLLKKLSGALSGDHPDIAAIRMALILGQSSTGDEHRGRGLPQIWNATQLSSVGGVGILSGKAYVGFDVANRQDVTGSYNTAMLGTVVNWTFPVDETGQADG